MEHKTLWVLGDWLPSQKRAHDRIGGAGPPDSPECALLWEGQEKLKGYSFDNSGVRYTSVCIP